MLLSTKTCHYQTPHAIIHKTYVTIVQLVLLSDTSTTHVIIRHLMLLSNKSCYYQTTHVIMKDPMLLSTPQPIILTLHTILLFPCAAIAHRGTTGTGTGTRLARIKARVHVQVRKKYFWPFFGFQRR